MGIWLIIISSVLFFVTKHAWSSNPMKQPVNPVYAKTISLICGGVLIYGIYLTFQSTASSSILGYILYGVLLLLALSWMWGVRTTPNIQYATVFGSFYFFLLSILFPFLHTNYLHLLWLIPAGFVLQFLSNFVFIRRVPILDWLLRTILNLYASLIRIGITSDAIGDR